MRLTDHLRTATRPAHDRIEAAFDLPARLVGRDSYRELLRSLLGFHLAFELAAAPHLVGTPLAGYLGRTALLSDDIAAIGGDAAHPDGPVPSYRDRPEVLGGLYVVEGSILGGVLIASEAERRLGIGPTTGAGFFAGHGRQTAATWRTFTAALEAEPCPDPAHALVGAEHTYAVMQAWLCGGARPDGGLKMATPPLLALQNIGLTFGGPPLLTSADLAVGSGERVALVGRNGSGKSTLLRIAAGLVEADRGERFAQPGATIRYLPQEPDMSGHARVGDYVEAGLGPADDLYRAHYLLGELGLTGDEHPGELSGGEGRRAALARTLAPDPDILLLDEPTNHLDLSTIEWLESELKGRRAALVLISHDRRFLQNLSRATVWLDRGTTRRIERGFGDFEEWRDAVYAEEEADRHKLDRKIAAEEHWVRYGVTARRKRNVRRMGELQSLRDERRTGRRQTGSAVLAAAEADSSGALVIEAKDIAKGYDGRHIVSGFSTRIRRGDRVGIVGPNGAGKTTLVKLLIGEIAPDGGFVRLGTRLETVALDQRRDSLDPNATLAEALTGGRSDTVMVGGQPRHVVGYLKDFLFGPEQARTPLRVLSGGERARLMLARALAQPSNLLVLDEPTNDLDLETLDVLEEMLAAYAGTVLLISHDRDFLDRLVTSVLVPEGGGTWREYAGGYTDMLAQRGTELAQTVGAGARRPEPRVAKETPSERGAAAAGARRRLNPKQQHALRTLPARIETLTVAIAGLSATLADPALFGRDPVAFTRTNEALATRTAELDAAETEWLDLEILREEIGA